MDGSLIADIVYYLVLYSALAMLAVPVVFFFLWKFLGFFRKHRRLFYIFCILLFSGVITWFYFTRNDWILWYHAFPSYIQIVGLLLFVASFMVMRMVDHHLGMKVRLFWPVLKGEEFKLVTGGVFKIVRHPIYALIPLLVLGSLLYTGEWMLIYPLLFNLLTRGWYARKEEACFMQFAAADYDNYRKRTQHRFYPKII